MSLLFMSLDELMEPYVLFFAWCRNTYMTIGGFTFSFMDFWVFQLFAGIIVLFIYRIFNM